MEKFEFEVDEKYNKTRIDKFLALSFEELKPEITRSKVQKLIESENVLVQEKVMKNMAHKVKFGDKIRVTLAKSAPQNLVAKEIDFGIVFEDDDLIVINKPAGLTVHPGAGNQSDTLVNGLLFSHGGKLSSINGDFRPGIVHRLDKDTSGLMLVAKNDFTHQKLSQDLQDKIIERKYLAFIYGVMNPESGKIEKAISRSRVNRLKMRVSSIETNIRARNATTNYVTKEVFCDGFASLIECKLETGRTHQIRVHLESCKHSLIGDQTYNSCKKNPLEDLSERLKEFVASFPRQGLHSYKIAFEHPRSGENMKFEIGLAPDLEELSRVLTNR